MRKPRTSLQRDYLMQISNHDVSGDIIRFTQGSYEEHHENIIKTQVNFSNTGGWWPYNHRTVGLLLIWGHKNKPCVFSESRWSHLVTREKHSAFHAMKELHKPAKACLGHQDRWAHETWAAPLLGIHMAEPQDLHTTGASNSPQQNF